MEPSGLNQSSKEEGLLTAGALISKCELEEDYNGTSEEAAPLQLEQVF